jgi:hypothetical protein
MASDLHDVLRWPACLYCACSLDALMAVLSIVRVCGVEAFTVGAVLWPAGAFIVAL